MGIKCFMKLLAHHLTDKSLRVSEIGGLCGTLPEIGEEKETVIGVDVSIYIYTMFRDSKFLDGFLKHCGKELTDSDVIRFVADRLLAVPVMVDLIAAATSTPKIKIMFVVDGDRPKYKIVGVDRNNRAQKAVEEFAEAMDNRDFDLARHKLIKSVRSSKQLGIAIQKGLSDRGFTCIIALEEADHLLAALWHSQMVSAVLTMDTDFIAHGVQDILFTLKGNRFRRFKVGTTLVFI